MNLFKAATRFYCSDTAELFALLNRQEPILIPASTISLDLSSTKTQRLFRIRSVKMRQGEPSCIVEYAEFDEIKQ